MGVSCRMISGSLFVLALLLVVILFSYFFGGFNVSGGDVTVEMY